MICKVISVEEKSKFSQSGLAHCASNHPPTNGTYIGGTLYLCILTISLKQRLEYLSIFNSYMNISSSKHHIVRVYLKVSLFGYSLPQL